jgi:hypothetical protein
MTVQRESLPPSQASYSVFKDFKFGFKLFEIFEIFDCLFAIIDSVETILPILFTTESCDFPHRFRRGSLFVRITCINSRLSFYTESRYSPYCTLRRVTTPRLIFSRVFLLTVESNFLKNYNLELNNHVLFLVPLLEPRICNVFYLFLL